MGKRAFIFDFDGVIIDDEKIWEEVKKHIYLKLYGRDIAQKLQKTSGLNIESINKLAQDNGSNVSLDQVFSEFQIQAKKIYKESPITEGIDDLISVLHKERYFIGIVSASPRDWIDIVLHRVSWSIRIKEIISLFDRADLAHKPAPDGYVNMMNLLNVRPDRTIVMEDSNTGIISAKKAGAYVIGLRQNLPDGYSLSGADYYVNYVSQVNDLVSKFEKQK